MLIKLATKSNKSNIPTGEHSHATSAAARDAERAAAACVTPKERAAAAAEALLSTKGSRETAASALFLFLLTSQLLERLAAAVDYSISRLANLN